MESHHPCEKKIKECGHNCTKKCKEACLTTEDCQKEILHTFECGHENKFKCFQKGTPGFFCKSKVSIFLPCGHYWKGDCGKKDKLCFVKVEKVLLCGHLTKVNCFNEKGDCGCRGNCTGAGEKGAEGKCLSCEIHEERKKLNEQASRKKIRVGPQKVKLVELKKPPQEFECVKYLSSPSPAFWKIEENLDSKDLYILNSARLMDPTNTCFTFLAFPDFDSAKKAAERKHVGNESHVGVVPSSCFKGTHMFLLICEWRVGKEAVDTRRERCSCNQLSKPHSVFRCFVGQPVLLPLYIAKFYCLHKNMKEHNRKREEISFKEVDEEEEERRRKQKKEEKEKKRKEEEELKMEERLCEICYEREKDHALEPCGHVFCYECILKFMDNKEKAKCPKCRQIFTQAKKIFLY